MILLIKEKTAKNKKIVKINFKVMTLILVE
jgi:hypothetical protein